MAKKRLALNEKLDQRIRDFKISKRKVARDLRITRPTLDKYLKNGKICDVGKREPHDLCPAQKKTIRTKYLS